MKQTIPFKKSINFNNKFETVTSLNLEHDYKVEEGLVKGFFNISGTTRSTEASLIDEEFKFEVPFEIALSNRIKHETVNISIEDFNYETSYNDTIILSINLNLECEEDEEIFSFINDLSSEIESDRGIDEDFIDMEEAINNFKDNEIDVSINVNNGDDKIIINNDETINYNNIYSFVSDKKDFVTYKIYFVKENENYESICNKFNITMEELLKYNEMKELQKGDKVIVPYVF